MNNLIEIINYGNPLYIIIHIYVTLSVLFHNAVMKSLTGTFTAPNSLMKTKTSIFKLHYCHFKKLILIFKYYVSCLYTYHRVNPSFMQQ